jgi:CheY-like chemotaxis protein
MEAAMSELQTATVNSTASASVSALALPLVLLADPDSASSARRAGELRERGMRVAVARTPFETIVKASCHLPDLILVDSSLDVDEAETTIQLLSTCPATAHIPVFRVATGHRLPAHVLTPER